MTVGKIGLRLVELRRHAGLSQAQLATRARWSRSKVAAVERAADPWLSELQRYLGALGWTLKLRKTGTMFQLVLGHSG